MPSCGSHWLVKVHDPYSFWSLEICTKVADRPPHSSKTTAVICVIHIEIFCCILHHTMHVTGSEVALHSPHCLQVPSSQIFAS